MVCAKRGVSLKDFVTQAIIRAVEDYEEELDILSLGKPRKILPITK